MIETTIDLADLIPNGYIGIMKNRVVLHTTSKTRKNKNYEFSFNLDKLELSSQQIFRAGHQRKGVYKDKNSNFIRYSFKLNNSLSLLR